MSVWGVVSRRGRRFALVVLAVLVGMLGVFVAPSAQAADDDLMRARRDRVREFLEGTTTPTDLPAPELPALRREMVGSAPSGPARGASATDPFCYKSLHNDPDELLIVDGAVYGPAFDCGEKLWAFGVLTWDHWAAIELSAYIVDFDTDANGATGCLGADRSAVTIYSNGLRSAMLRTPSCDSDTWTVGPELLVSRAGETDFVAVGVTHGQLGSPSRFRWRASTNSIYSYLWDLMPSNGGYHTAEGFLGGGTTAPNDVIRYGTGSGLSPATTVNVAGVYDHAVGGDFDGNGRGDALFVGDGSAPDQIRRGTLSGLSAPVAVSIGAVYDHVVAGDFDGNGRDDVVLVRNGAGDDTLRRGTVSGLGASQALNLGGAPDRLLAGDFDGNGRDDLLAVGFGDQPDWVRYGTGSGFTRAHDVSFKGRPDALVVADFDGDGRDDVLVAKWGSGRDVIRRGAPSGFSPGDEVTIVGSYDLAVGGDFDGDGRGDVLLYGEGGAADAIRYGSATGLQGATTVNVGGAFPFGVEGNFDGDGRDDALFYLPG